MVVSADGYSGSGTTTIQNTSGFTITRVNDTGTLTDGNFSFVALSQGVTIPPPPPTPGGGGGAVSWGNVHVVSGGATLTAGLNVGSVLRTDVGSVTVNFATNIITAYSVTVSPLISGGEVTVTSQGASSFTIERSNEFGVAIDGDFTFTVNTSGVAPSPPPPSVPQAAFAWGYVQLNSSNASLISSYNLNSAVRTDVGTVTITLSSTPAFAPYAVLLTPSQVAGSCVETSQSGNQIVVERGSLFGTAIDANFSILVFANG